MPSRDRALSFAARVENGTRSDSCGAQAGGEVRHLRVGVGAARGPLPDLGGAVIAARRPRPGSVRGASSPPTECDKCPRRGVRRTKRAAPLLRRLITTSSPVARTGASADAARGRTAPRAASPFRGRGGAYCVKLRRWRAASSPASSPGRDSTGCAPCTRSSSGTATRRRRARRSWPGSRAAEGLLALLTDRVDAELHRGRAGAAGDLQLRRRGRQRGRRGRDGARDPRRPHARGAHRLDRGPRRRADARDRPSHPRGRADRSRRRVGDLGADLDARPRPSRCHGRDRRPRADRVRRGAAAGGLRLRDRRRGTGRGRARRGTGGGRLRHPAHAAHARDSRPHRRASSCGR